MADNHKMGVTMNGKPCVWSDTETPVLPWQIAEGMRVVTIEEKNRFIFVRERNRQ